VGKNNNFDNSILRIYICREELDQDPQSTLELYLTTVLTKWEEPYKERAELLMNLIPNKKGLLDLFSKLLFAKVSQCAAMVL